MAASVTSVEGKEEVVERGGGGVSEAASPKIAPAARAAAGTGDGGGGAVPGEAVAVPPGGLSPGLDLGVGVRVEGVGQTSLDPRKAAFLPGGRRLPLAGSPKAQFAALLHKQRLAFRRQPWMLVAMLLGPAVAVAIAGILQGVVRSNAEAAESTANDWMVQQAVGVGGLMAPADGAQLIRYAPSCLLAPCSADAAVADSVMARVTETSSKALTIGVNVIGYADTAALAEGVLSGFAGNSSTFAAVNLMFSNLDGATKAVEYTVGYNGTQGYTGTFNHGLRESTPLAASEWSLAQVGFQVALDAALVAELSNGNVEIPSSIIINSRPAIALVVAGSPEWIVSSFIAGPLLMLAYTVVALIATKQVVHERTSGLLTAMRFTGLHESVYWAQWQVFYFVFALISAILASAVGLAFQLDGFKDTPLVQLVSVLWISNASFTAFALVIASAVTSKSGGDLVPVAVITLNLAIHGTFAGVSAGMDRPASAFGASGWDMMYSPAASMLAKLALNLTPVFHFGKLWDDLLKQSGPQPSGADSNPGDFGSSHRFALGSASETFWVMPGAANLFILWLLYIAFVVVAWHRGRPMVGGATGCTQAAMSRRLRHECGCCCRRPAGQSQVLRTGIVAQSQEASGQDGSIILHKVTKAYNSGTAVKEMSLTMHAGEVCALLGHNGAGKSTTVNLLSGQTPISSGDAFIHGMDIRTDMPSIRGLLGVCPQHDILFEPLSGEQHLRFWGQFKGIPTGAELESQVAKLLREVQLFDKKDNPVSSYSGGMRRRVSLACATIGDAPILFLDECTTGMDVVVRRVVWDLVQRRKEEGAVVVLTTHSMEEADALADQVAVMSEGRLRAIGSPLFLKSRYGTGYHISLQCKPQDTESVTASVRGLLPGADILCPSPGVLSVGLPKKCMRALPSFFRQCEAGTRGITEWAISNATLEECFLRLTEASRGVNVAVAGVGAGAARVLCVLCNHRPTELCTLVTKTGKEVQTPDLVCAVCADGADDTGDGLTSPLGDFGDGAAVPVYRSPDFKEEGESLEAVAGNATVAAHREPLSEWRSIRALLTKSTVALCGTCSSREGRAAHYRMSQQEQSKSNGVAQTMLIIATLYFIIAPAITMSSIYMFGNGGSHEVTPERQEELHKVEHQYDRFTETCTLNDGWPETRWYEQFGYPFGICEYRVLASIVQTQLTNCSAKHQESLMFNCTVVQPWSNLVPSSTQRRARVWSRGVPISTDAIAHTITDSPKVEMQRSTKMLLGSTSSLRDLDCEAPKSHGASSWMPVAHSQLAGAELFQTSLPDVIVAMDQPESVNAYTYISIDAQFNKHYPLAAVLFDDNETVAPSDDCGMFGIGGEAKQLGLLSVARGVQQGFTDVAEVNVNVSSTWFRLPSPDFGFRERARVAPAKVVAISQTVCFCVSTICSLAYSAYVVASERDDGLRSMIFMQGVTQKAYGVALLLSGCILPLLQSFINVLFNLIAFPLASRWHSTVVGAVVAVLAMALNTSSLAVVLGSLLHRRNTALISFVVSLGLMTGCALGWMFNWPWILQLLLPHFAGASALYNSLDTQSPAKLALSFGLLAVSSSFWWLWAMHLLGLVQLVPRAWTASRRPRAGDDVEPVSTRSGFSQFGGGDDGDSSDGEQADEQIRGLWNSQQRRDEDVVAEEEAVKDATVEDTERHAIFMDNVFKTFPRRGMRPPVRAVRGVSLRIAYGGIFGLLGPNGAGKTTLIRALTGEDPITGGEAFIAGKNCRTETDTMRRALGVVPQFDALWGHASVRQHFHVFGALAGLTGTELLNAVDRVSEDLELDGDCMDRPAGLLSGGQRRRVSIGCAVIGDSRVVFLDEPTTGLDPATRQQVWGVIRKLVSPDRCIVMTSHSMEEVEALCSNIGIMVRGKLQCLGSPARLKRKYGGSMRLSVSSRRGDAARSAAASFVTEQVSAAALPLRSFGQSQTFTLPRNVAASEVFELMRTKAAKAGIQEWSLTQATLESVFFEIVRLTGGGGGADTSSRSLQSPRPQDGSTEEKAHAE